LGVSAGTTGTLSPTSGTVFLQAGTLAGSGQILGSLTVGSATVAPGFSPGSLAISGDLSMSSGSTLSMELGGTAAGSSDALVVGGSANLAGSLVLSSYGGFAPTGTDQFTLLDAGSVTGAFAQSQTTDSLLGGLSFSQLQMTVGNVTSGIPSTTVLFTPVIDLGSQTTDPLPDLTSTVVDAGSVTATQLAPPSYNPTATIETVATANTSTTTTSTSENGTTSSNTSASSSTSTTTTATPSTFDQAADSSTSGTTSEEDKKKAEEEKKAATSNSTSGTSAPGDIAPTPSTVTASNNQASNAPLAPTTVRSGEVASLGIEPEPQTNVVTAPSGNKEVTYAPAKAQDEKGSGGKSGPAAADEKC
jgi:hypothetical protein